MDQAIKLTIHNQSAQGLIQQVREAILDYEAFTTLLRPCELSRCRATCCHDGVYLDREEMNHVKSFTEEHHELLRSWGWNPSPKFFESVGRKGWKTKVIEAKPGELSEDFPEHFPKTRCVFLDQESRCQIQRLDMELGNSPWYHKPLTCWLHPLLILPPDQGQSRPLLTIAKSHNDPQEKNGYPGFASCTHCGREDPKGMRADLALASELAYLLEMSGRNLNSELSL